MIASVASAQVRCSRSISLGRSATTSAERAVLQLGPGAAEQPLRLVLEAGPLPGTRGCSRHCSAAVQREDHRPREQPVEEQELGGAALGLESLVGAQERLVGAAGAQRGAPGRARRSSAAVATSREVMSARSIERPEHQELPALVAGHRRVGDAVDLRGAVAHPAEARPAAASRGTGPRGSRGRSCSSPPTSRSTASRGPGGRSRGRRPSVAAIEAGGRRVVGEQVEHRRRCRSVRLVDLDPHDRQQAAAGGLLVDPGSSRISWVCTSRIRAVSSARST